MKKSQRHFLWLFFIHHYILWYGSYSRYWHKWRRKLTKRDVVKIEDGCIVEQPDFVIDAAGRQWLRVFIPHNLDTI